VMCVETETDYIYIYIYIIGSQITECDDYGDFDKSDNYFIT